MRHSKEVLQSFNASVAMAVLPQVTAAGTQPQLQGLLPMVQRHHGLGSQEAQLSSSALPWAS